MSEKVAVWKEAEDNVRDEILEPAQFEELQVHSAAYLAPINLVAYATGMAKRSESGMPASKVKLLRRLWAKTWP